MTEPTPQATSVATRYVIWGDELFEVGGTEILAGYQLSGTDAVTVREPNGQEALYAAEGEGVFFRTSDSGMLRIFRKPSGNASVERALITYSPSGWHSVSVARWH